MSVQSEIERISNNVQSTLNTIAETGVEVGQGSDALPAAAAALANEKAPINHTHAYNELTGKPDIPSKLSDLSEDVSHRTVTDTEKAAWGAKSDFSGSYNDLSDKPTIPSKTSQLTNDSNFLTAVPDGYAKEEDLPTKLSDLSADSTHRTVTDAEKAAWSAKSDFSGAYADLSGKPTIPTALSDLTADASHRTVTDTEKSTWNAKSDFSGSYNDLTNKPTIPAAYSHPDTHPASMITGLATVATSGSYNDLSNKPTIPAAYTHPSTHAASMISAGTFAGQVVANANGQDPGTALIRNIQASSTDLEAGVSNLATGTIYIVYEE